MIDANGGPVTNLLAAIAPGDDSVAWMPVWSPDRQRIAFIRANWDEGRELYVMNADGSNPHPLFAIPLVLTDNPRWSPDGGSLVVGYGFDVGVVRADGLGNVRIAASEAFYPYWTPSGGFVYVKGSAAGGRIFVMDQSGKEHQLIPNAGTANWTTTVIPCGCGGSAPRAASCGRSSNLVFILGHWLLIG